MSSSSDDQQELEFSDDCSEVTWNSAKRFKLVFGKNKGKRLGALVKRAKHRDYLRWLLTWDEIRPDTAANITCCLQHYDDLKSRRQ